MVPMSVRPSNSSKHGCDGRPSSRLNEELLRAPMNMFEAAVVDEELLRAPISDEELLSPTRSHGAGDALIE